MRKPLRLGRSTPTMLGMADRAAAAAKVLDLQPLLQQQQATRELFEAAIAPLEQRDGRLGGAGRELCFDAFAECPDGFTAACEKALRRARSSSLGLLIKLIRDGEHRFDPISPLERGETPTHRVVDECMGACGKTAPLVDVDGKLLCDSCRGTDA